MQFGLQVSELMSQSGLMFDIRLTLIYQPRPREAHLPRFRSYLIDQDKFASPVSTPIKDK
jgi:hypothetical protein